MVFADDARPPFGDSQFPLVFTTAMLFEVQAHGLEIAAGVGIVQGAAQGGFQHQAGGLAADCRHAG